MTKTELWKEFKKHPGTALAGIALGAIDAFVIIVKGQHRK